MDAPIVVHENGDVVIFASVERAERYLEPIDVEAGRLTAYDSAGRLLRLVPTSPRITIEAAEAEPTHNEELRESLRELLSHVGVAEDQIDRMSIQEMVKRALEYKIE